MSQGTVKFFNETKGYGFIVDDETEKEVFVHVSGLDSPVKQNDRVSYRIVEDKRGSKAVEVKQL